ncbi:MAG: threonine synthase [Actinomycetia bacterium]|nr:threonine synthase [Actinomycetes bacterium]
MLYKSTRGDKKHVSSAEAILSGIAPDGGLYVPASMPSFDRPLENLIHMDYRELSYYIVSKFFTDFEKDILAGCINDAYDEKFDDRRIVPIIERGGVHFIELFHGPTLAFKDIALTMLPHLLKAAVKKMENKNEIVILTATSGDTGKAALGGFSDVEGTRIIVFYPRDGVSRIQERQMTAHEGRNTHVIAIEGNFDDAQKGVKAIFGDREFAKTLAKNGYMFSSANSINIGRLIPQIVYYVHIYLHLLKNSKIKNGEKINIAVPTGNFGNILAAYYSRRMGLPVKRLICASNINNVLYDFINTGVYNRKRKFMVTSSPAMDILVSSNLERLLFDLADQDPGTVRHLISKLSEEGEFKISESMKKELSGFYGGFATEEETSDTIRNLFKNNNYLIDTHTAVGYCVYKKYLRETADDTRTVIASTASPFKFPGSVAGAIDEKYRNRDEFSLLEVLSDISGLKIPEAIAGIAEKKVIHNNSCTIEDMKDAVAGILGI